MANEDMKITLDLDDGTELECEILGLFEVAGKEYIALYALDGSEDIYIYEYKELGEEEFELIDIVDDEEFEAASAELTRLMEEEI